MEYKKEQIAKEQEAKKKAEQDAKDRQPGHCTILNSAGGGTFSLLEAKSTINVELKAKNNNMLLKKNMKVLRRTTKFVGQLFNAAKGPVMNFGKEAIGGLFHKSGPSSEEKDKYKQQMKDYEQKKQQHKDAVKGEEKHKNHILEQDQKENDKMAKHEQDAKNRVSQLQNFAVDDGVVSNNVMSKGDCKRSCDQCPSAHTVAR